MNLLIICSLIVLAIVFDAMEDALNREPLTKSAGHTGGEWLIIAYLVFGSLWNPQFNSFMDWIGVIMSMGFAFIGFRFALFTPFWNLFAHQKLNYLGETVWQDRVEKHYMPPWAFWPTRIFFLAFGIACVFINLKIYG